MRVLLAASECMPFVKTGGLADVVGTLPKALVKLGVDARVILPKYGGISHEYKSQMTHVFDTQIGLGWRTQYLGVEQLVKDGVTYYFIDNEFYFGHTYVYGSGSFEAERFCYFCEAVLQALPHIDFLPDILHCNDWQTGFIPLLLATQYKRLPQYHSIKSIFTIHNLRFQGVCDHMLADDLLSIGSEALASIEYGGGASAMKAGIMYSNSVTTVSPTYANEIQTPEYGETLDCVLRDRSSELSGILNGIDNVLYNPWTDKALAARYSKNTVYTSSKHGDGKLICKAALQSEMGMGDDTAPPLLAVISRLTDQKGIDLIAELLPRFMANGARLIVLGMGDKRYEGLFALCAEKYSGRFAFRSEMNDALARRIYAGADIFLMPSAFEPCGLSQMLALRYGCVPIVRETGGLSDTVQAYNRFNDSGNGFSFKHYSAEELLLVSDMAIELYSSDKPAWARLVQRAMATDYGWECSARKYIGLYQKLFVSMEE